MNCPTCKQPGVDGRNFCGACGGRLVQYCRLCGFRNREQDRFCGGCGAGLVAKQERPAPRVPPAEAASRTVPVPAPSAAATPASPLAELIEAARETEQVEQQQGDIKVSQDDIDSLFGD